MLLRNFNELGPVMFILPQVLHETCRCMPEAVFGVKTSLLRIVERLNTSVHQICFQGVIFEKDVFVELVLSFTPLAWFLLRHQVVKEFNEFNAHVWV